MSETVASQLGSDATRSQRGAAWRGYAVVFAATALFLYLRNFRGGVFVWGISQQEGTWIDEAFFTLQGELIYRDFFEMMPPGIVYINTFFLWLLGPTTTSVGIIVVIIGVLCALAIYAISASVLSGYWRYVPAAIFVGLTYPSYSLLNHKWPTIILCLLGILAVLEKRSRLRCALSGMAHGGAMLCTQDFGAGAAFGMLVALWLLRGRKDGSHPVIFAVACGLTVVVVLGGFAAAAGLATVWYAVVAYMFEQYGSIHVLAVEFGGLRNFSIWCTSFGLGGLGLAYALIGIAMRFWRSDPPSLVIIALPGAALLVIGGVMHPIEPTLFGVRAVPLTIVGTYLLQRMVQRRTAHPWPLAGLTVLGVILLADAALRPIRTQFVLALLPEAHRAGALLAPHGFLDDLAWLEANTVEGQPIFLYPDKAGFYFLTRTRSATYYPKLFDMSISSDAQVADAIRQLASKCPAVGIWHRSRLLAFGLNRPELNTLKPLEEALMRDYDVVAEFPNGASGLRRKASASGCGT